MHKLDAGFREERYSRILNLDYTLRVYSMWKQIWYLIKNTEISEDFTPRFWILALVSAYSPGMLEPELISEFYWS